MLICKYAFLMITGHLADLWKTLLAKRPKVNAWYEAVIPTFTVHKKITDLPEEEINILALVDLLTG